jgi:anthranilate phosphoribosyltransferase
MITNAIKQLVEGRDLSSEETHVAMMQVMSGDASPAQISAFLVALRMKGETPDEIAGCARAMRAHVTPATPTHSDLVDTCGTGGDAAHTFNVSTAAAFVAAAAGARVAKHMGRSVSSASGSAEVLEALGANIALSPAQTGQAIDRLGLGFMFAPAHHAAMKHAAPVRKELGVRTLFNILGPLTNPAGAVNQVMGVFHPDLVGIQVRALQRLGSKHVMIVYGMEGLDEISISGETLVGELANGEISEYTLHPQQFGIELYDRRAIQVNTVDESKQMILAVLEGQPGPALNIVLLNAGAAIYVAGVADSMQAGIDRARRAIAKGEARQKLDEFVAFTRKAAAGG